MFYLLISTFVSFLFILNWRIIALQDSVGFCHSSTRSSHGCTCPLLPELHSHLQPHPTPLGFHRAPSLCSLRHIADSHWLAILHMLVCFHVTLSVQALSFPDCVHKSVLCVCISTAAQQIGSSVLSF